MLRKFVGAAVVLVLAAGLALSEDKKDDKKDEKKGGKGFVGMITKASATSITVHGQAGGRRGDGAKKGEGEKKAGEAVDRTFTVTSDTKVYHFMGRRGKGEKGERTEVKIEDLVTAVNKADAKVFGRVLHDKDIATEISYGSGRGPGGKDKAKDKAPPKPSWHVLPESAESTLDARPLDGRASSFSRQGRRPPIQGSHAKRRLG